MRASLFVALSFGVLFLGSVSCGQAPTAPTESPESRLDAENDTSSAGDGTAIKRVEVTFEGADMNVEVVGGLGVGTYFESIPAITEAVVERGRVDAVLVKKNGRRSFPVIEEIDRDGDGSTDLKIRKNVGYAKGLLIIKYWASRPVQTFDFVGSQTVHTVIFAPE